jgi:hypothetical protein
MIKILLGTVIGIGLATTFPDQTADFSEFLRGKINEGAQVIVEQTDQSMVDKLRN